MDGQTKAAILRAISRLGAFVPAEVPQEVKIEPYTPAYIPTRAKPIGAGLRVKMADVNKVIEELAEAGILISHAAEVGPKLYWKVEKPADLEKKIDYAVLQ